MHNSKYQYHMPTCCTFYYLLTARQEPYEKAYILTKNIAEFSRKSSGEWASRQKKKIRQKE